MVVRGVEQSFWDSADLPSTMVTEVGKSRANTIRVLPYLALTTPTREPNCGLAIAEDVIRRGIAAKMLVDVAIDGGQLLASYLRPDVRAMLMKYQQHIVLHGLGESTVSTGGAWVNQATHAIAELRRAGYICPLYIESNTYGRNLPTILSHGRQVVDADPLHNIVLGWQAYWGSSNFYQNLCGTTLRQGIEACAQTDFPIQVGIMEHTDPWSDPNEAAPYRDLMQWCQEFSLGWLWWDWHMASNPVDQCTRDGLYGHWDTQGEDVLIANPYGIEKTSVKPAFLEGAQRSGA
jgi:hypothetical protein